MSAVRASVLAAAAAFGLQPLGADMSAEQPTSAWGTQLSPVTQASQDGAPVPVVSVAGAGSGRGEAQAERPEEAEEGSDDSDLELLLAAAVWAEARRLPGPLPVATEVAESRDEPPATDLAAEAPEADEPPGWALTALRSRDVAASVFRLLDARAQENMAALNVQVRDALLIAACVDPAYWVGPSAALAATAVVAQRVVREARASRSAGFFEEGSPQAAAPAAPASQAASAATLPAVASAWRWPIRLQGRSA